MCNEASVENRNMSKNENIIHEGKNTNRTRDNVDRENEKDTKDISKQQSKKGSTYRDVLIRSNYS